MIQEKFITEMTRRDHGAALVRLRVSASLTQAEASRATGVPLPVVQQIELGMYGGRLCRVRRDTLRDHYLNNPPQVGKGCNEVGDRIGQIIRAQRIYLGLTGHDVGKLALRHKSGTTVRQIERGEFSTRGSRYAMYVKKIADYLYLDPTLLLTEIRKPATPDPIPGMRLRMH